MSIKLAKINIKRLDIPNIVSKYIEGKIKTQNREKISIKRRQEGEIHLGLVLKFIPFSVPLEDTKTLEYITSVPDILKLNSEEKLIRNVLVIGCFIQANKSIYAEKPDSFYNVKNKINA